MSVYQYVVRHQGTIPYMRIWELAAEAHVFTTTILRFCKKLGCDSYAEFKLRLKESAGHQNIARIPEDLSELKTLQERVESPAYRQELDEAAMIAKADRMLCAGAFNSGYIAQFSDLYLAHCITMRRGKADVDFTQPQIESIIDYSTQVPALIVAETLAKRVAGRLQEE